MYLHPYEFSSKKILNKNINIIDFFKNKYGRKKFCLKLNPILNYMIKTV